MKSIKLAICAAALATAAAACGDSGKTDPAANPNARPTATVQPAPAAATPTPDELATARADFSQFCVRCHKVEGTGGVEDVDGKKVKVPSLREHGKKDSDEHLAEKIRDGDDDMPSFKNRLDEARINALVRFIRKEFHGAAGTATASPSR